MKLAIRAPNWVGDLVMATPVLEAARRATAPGGTAFTELTIVVRRHLAPVLRDGPLEPFVRGIAHDREEAATYASVGADAVLLLSNSFGAAWRARHVRLRAGSALSGRRFLLTHVVVPPAVDGRRVPIPSAHLMRDVAGLVGLEVPDLHPRLAVRDEIVRRERERLARLGVDLGQGWILCCPGAAFGAAKLWPPECFAEALDAIAERTGARGVVTGGPGEEDLVDAVAEASERGAISLAREPRDLEGLKALVAGARLLLVGDSGPRWYAAAFDVPTVSVMGPNFPELTASSLELARIVRLEGLECAPCLERACPLGHHRCLRELPVERVVAAAREVLALAGDHGANRTAAAVPVG